MLNESKICCRQNKLYLQISAGDLQYYQLWCVQKEHEKSISSSLKYLFFHNCNVLLQQSLG